MSHIHPLSFCSFVNVWLKYCWKAINHIHPFILVYFLQLLSLLHLFLSPAFSKKSGGTLFLVFRGAWRVVRGAWRVARGAWCVVRGAWRVARGAWRVVRGAWFRVFSGYFVPLTPPTVYVRSFWNFIGVLRMVWRYACGFFRILK